MPGIPGAYDSFAMAILAEGDSRADFVRRENDRVRVDGVADDTDALGSFGCACFAETSDRLKVVATPAA